MERSASHGRAEASSDTASLGRTSELGGHQSAASAAGSTAELLTQGPPGAGAGASAVRWRRRPDDRLKRAVRRVLIALSFKSNKGLSRSTENISSVQFDLQVKQRACLGLLSMEFSSFQFGSVQFSSVQFSSVQFSSQSNKGLSRSTERGAKQQLQPQHQQQSLQLSSWQLIPGTSVPPSNYWDPVRHPALQLRHDDDDDDDDDESITALKTRRDRKLQFSDIEDYGCSKFQFCPQIYSKWGF